ncbi:carbohydrate kinase family protein [Patescibacteria group bacterium]|nr:carbohydrate kinase family protein [Patescibacteria group bacterium]
MYDVICFGSATEDIFIDTGLREVNKKIVYPVGTKIPIKSLNFGIGGVGINVSVGLSRMNLKVAYIGKMGNDEAGSRILDCLKKEKIDFIGTKTQGVTGYGFILDTYERERTILTYHGLTDNFKFNEINKNKIKTKWMFFSSLRGESIKTEDKMVQWCKKNGIKVAFNMDAKVVHKAKLNLDRILKNLDLIILNKEEAQSITKGEDPKTLVRGIHNLGTKMVVLTDGRDPAYAFDGKKIYTLIPHKGIKLVERTGAGDAFTSGFLAGYIKTQDIEKSLKIASLNSESVIQHFGAHNKLLKWDEVNKKLSSIKN